MNFIFFILLLIFISGCKAKEEKTQPVENLSFSSVKTIPIPPVGNKIPSPRSLGTTRDNKIIVLDDAGRVIEYAPGGTKVEKIWWMPAYALGRPEGVCELRDGRIAVTDTHYSRVVIFTPDGKVSKIFGKKGPAPGEIGNPVGISEAADGSIYICEYGMNDRIQQFTVEGKFIRAISKSGTGPGELQRPSGVIPHNGKLYVVDAVNNRIQVFNEKSGKFERSITVKPPFYLPYDLKFDSKGNMYVIEYGNNCITKLSPTGKLLGKFKPENGEGFKTPWGIAVDANGNVYVADTGNRRIVKLTP